jgi:excisionase family DNA binding protein
VEYIFGVEDKLLTTKEAADELGLTLRAVQKMIESGRLKAEKYGRDYLIPLTSLDGIERKSKAGRPPKVKQDKNKQ